jgi:amino acid transporter
VDALNVSLQTLTLGLNTVGTVFAIIGAFAGWLFVLRYRRHNWRVWVAGQHIMKMTFGLALILTYVVIFQIVTYLVEPNPWLDLAVRVGRLGIFGWICWLLVERVMLLNVSRSSPDKLLTPVEDDSRSAEMN